MLDIIKFLSKPCLSSTKSEAVNAGDCFTRPIISFIIQVLSLFTHDLPHICLLPTLPPHCGMRKLIDLSRSQDPSHPRLILPNANAAILASCRRSSIRSTLLLLLRLLFQGSIGKICSSNSSKGTWYADTKGHFVTCTESSATVVVVFWPRNGGCGSGSRCAGGPLHC